MEKSFVDQLADRLKLAPSTSISGRPAEVKANPTEAVNKPGEVKSRPTEAVNKPAEVKSRPTEALNKPAEVKARSVLFDSDSDDDLFSNSQPSKLPSMSKNTADPKGTPAKADQNPLTPADSSQVKASAFEAPSVTAVPPPPTWDDDDGDDDNEQDAFFDLKENKERVVQKSLFDDSDEEEDDEDLFADLKMRSPTVAVVPDNQQIKVC